MHSPLTHQQLIQMIVLTLLGFALWHLCAPFWRRQGNRWMMRLSYVFGALCGVCAGVFMGGLIMYGLVP